MQISLIYFLFLAPLTSLRVNSKRTKKTPGYSPHPSPLQRCYPELVEGRGEDMVFFTDFCKDSLSKNRKKVEPEFNKARPDLLFYRNVGTEQTQCRFG